jgi:hypothetical protein
MRESTRRPEVSSCTVPTANRSNSSSSECRALQIFFRRRRQNWRSRRQTERLRLVPLRRYPNSAVSYSSRVLLSGQVRRDSRQQEHVVTDTAAAAAAAAAGLLDCCRVCLCLSVSERAGGRTSDPIRRQVDDGLHGQSTQRGRARWILADAEGWPASHDDEEPPLVPGAQSRRRGSASSQWASRSSSSGEIARRHEEGARQRWVGRLTVTATGGHQRSSGASLRSAATRFGRHRSVPSDFCASSRQEKAPDRPFHCLMS